MKTILAVVLMAFAAQAATPVVASCPATPVAVKKVVKRKKVAKKPAPTPAPIVVVFEAEPIVVEKVVTKTVTETVVQEAPVPEVVVTSPSPTTWTVSGGKADVVWHKLVDQKDILWMGHAAVGFGAPYQDSSGLLGLRVKVPAASLGVEAYTAFDYGLGIMALVYPYQDDILAWHLNLGVLGWQGERLSTWDVPRTWDITAGTGIEVKLMKHLSFTFDYKASLPSPIFIAEHSSPVFVDGAQILGEDGRYLDVKHVLGNSFLEGQLMFGLLVY